MKLDDWLALARIAPDEPLPSNLRIALADAASRVQAFALTRRLQPPRAAAEMARAVGFTSGEVEGFRKEQNKLLATMFVEGNRHMPEPPKIEALEDQMAKEFGVTNRQIRRWRKGVMKKDI